MSCSWPVFLHEGARGDDLHAKPRLDPWEIPWVVGHQGDSPAVHSRLQDHFIRRVWKRGSPTEMHINAPGGAGEGRQEVTDLGWRKSVSELVFRPGQHRLVFQVERCSHKRPKATLCDPPHNKIAGSRAAPEGSDEDRCIEDDLDHILECITSYEMS